MVSAPRFYFQCEGHEPTLLLIKTTQKEVRRDQRELGVLVSDEPGESVPQRGWVFLDSPYPGSLGLGVQSRAPLQRGDSSLP